MICETCRDQGFVRTHGRGKLVLCLDCGGRHTEYGYAILVKTGDAKWEFARNKLGLVLNARSRDIANQYARAIALRLGLPLERDVFVMPVAIEARREDGNFLAGIEGQEEGDTYEDFG